MTAADQANHDLTHAKNAVEQRAAVLGWVRAMIDQRENNGSREHAGRYLAAALLDLGQGYTPPLLRPTEDVEVRGKTRGGRANARARAVAAARIAEEAGMNTSRANEWVSFWCGMTITALRKLRENVDKGKQREVGSLILAERQKWEAQMLQATSTHETLYYLAMTEVGYDRAFHKK
jgi:hypothetical protein